MGTTFGVQDERVKVWSAILVPSLVVFGWLGAVASGSVTVVLAALGVVFLGALLALTVFETAGRELVAAAGKRKSVGPGVVGDALEVLSALVFLGGIGSLPFARTVFGDIATLVSPLSVLLMLAGLAGMIGTVLFRTGHRRLRSSDATERS